MTQRSVNIILGGALGIASLAGVLFCTSSRAKQIAQITGAVLAQDLDPHKQRPIQNAVVVAEYGGITGTARTDSDGSFSLRLRTPVQAGEPVRLRADHPDFRSFATVASAGEQIHILRMKPKRTGDPKPQSEPVTISNVRVRYATKAVNTVNVASVVRTFDVLNTGNVPCNGKRPCSPDGKWKATIGSISVDAGEDNKFFRNARVSCIAGPCSFTKIESDDFSRGGRAISVAVRNWSDRVTYVLEAEVAQTVQSEMIRHAYPVIFGRLMNFTLPASSQGPSIEAEVDRAEIVFPLGPKLRLSWANCLAEQSAEGSRLYRCELKAGYRFQ